MRHALPLLVCAWYGGLSASRLWPETLRAPSAMVVLGLATWLTLRPHGLAARREGAACTRARARVGTLALITLATLAGLSMSSSPTAATLPAGIARFDAKVLAQRARGRAVSSTVTIERGRMLESGEALPLARVRVHAALPVGARVRLLAKLRPMARFHNATPHPAWPSESAAAGSARLIEGVPARVLSRDGLRGALETARDGAREALERSLPADVVGVARALLLGEGGALEPDDRAHVRAAGLAHLMAVSGLHITLLVGLLVASVRRLTHRLLTDSDFWASCTGCALAPLLAAFAGGAPSAQRAALTACLALGMRAMHRRVAPVPLSAAAVLLLTLYRPEDALSPALLLSVLATSALLGGGMEGDALTRMGRSAGRALTATLPFTAYVFGQAPLLGWCVNVLILPLFALLLVPLTWLHAGLAYALPGVSALTAPCLTVLVRALLAASAAAAQLGPTSSLPPLSWPQGVALACGAVLGLHVLGLRVRRLRYALLLLGGLGLLLGGLELRLRAQEQPRHVLRATYLDIGQGDGALVDLPDGRLMMIDAGPREGLAPERALLPLLAARRRTHVDVFVLTHGHPDHYGGLEALLDAGVPIRELWLNRQPEDEAPGEGVSRLIRRARDAGTHVVYADALCGRPRMFGEASALLLAPCPGYDSGFDLNDNSLVLRLSLGRRRLLFTGDVEALAEHGLLRLGHALYADVLKVPHHGSRSSSTSRFLDLVRPRWSVVSCGRQNRFGHPHAETLARLDQVATYALRTDSVGGVVVETDGERLDIRSALPWPSLPTARGVLEAGVDLRGARGALDGAAESERGDPVAAVGVVEVGVAGARR